MNYYKEILTNIELHADELMTEDGIHHDDWSDREHEYIPQILEQIAELYDLTITIE